MSVNGNQIAQVRDSTFMTGNPGIGFFRRACGTVSDVGFQNFSVTGSNGGPTPITPVQPDHELTHSGRSPAARSATIHLER